MVTTNKYCLHCSEKIKGRSDKKFCDDACRNAYNNVLHGKLNQSIRKTNSILKSNRNILEKILEPETKHVQVTRQLLLSKGFRMNYLTHLVSSPQGNQYFFCYEYGMMIKGEEVVVVKRENNCGLKPA